MLSPLHAAILCTLLTNLILVTAKIHGGPRGRFDKEVAENQKGGKVYERSWMFGPEYEYSPPPHLKFMCRHCTTMSSYPVFHGVLPVYVYKYRRSYSKFGALISGLGLYNLGRSAEYWHNAHYYTKRADEQCSLQVIDRNHFEEASIPCLLMSSFLDNAEIKGSDGETIDITADNAFKYVPEQHAGPPLRVTSETECVAWHNTTANEERRSMPCGLLITYANTLKPSDAFAAFMWLPMTLAVVVAIAVCFQNFCRRKEFKYEAEVVEHEQRVGDYLINS